MSFDSLFAVYCVASYPGAHSTKMASFRVRSFKTFKIPINSNAFHPKSFLFHYLYLISERAHLGEIEVKAKSLQCTTLFISIVKYLSIHITT